MDMEKRDSSAVVDKALTIAKVVSFVCLLTGIGSVICGALTFVFADPVWQFPYTTASGLWAGLVTLMQGVFGFVLISAYDKSLPHISYKWLSVFLGLAQGSAICGGQHLGYSIAGTVNCAVRSTDNKGVEKCNAEEHDNLLIVQAVSLVFGVIMLTEAIITLYYFYSCGRFVQLTGKSPRRCCGRC